MSASSQLKEMPTRWLSFVVFFGIFGPLIYFLSDLYKFPLITYFPATGEVFLGWKAFNEEAGPAMYWYGWILTSIVLSSVLSLFLALVFSPGTKFLASLLNLTWITILCIFPFLVYSLKFYWK
jgi:hypothetical protein